MLRYSDTSICEGADGDPGIQDGWCMTKDIKGDFPSWKEECFIYIDDFTVKGG